VDFAGAFIEPPTPNNNWRFAWQRVGVAIPTVVDPSTIADSSTAEVWFFGIVDKNPLS
jgi:hypothetical protein